MKLYGLIGYPLAHSFSQQYFAEKFAQQKIADIEYRNFPIENISELKRLLTDYPALEGLNVTIPYKEQVMDLLDECDTTAKEVGAVNCIRISNGRMHGFNTDVYGFQMSIKPFLENKYERALILGTGGASKAVAYVLKQWNIPYYFATRNPKSNNHLAYSQLTDSNIHHFPLIINTTPLGTFPQVDQAPPLPYDALSADHFLYDLVYNPAMTTFLSRGKEQGAHTMNGLKMLQLQAERSWQIWNE